MACLNSLKQDIRKLEEIFPKSHERLQLIVATVDELTVRFIGNNNKKYEIHANFTETYPEVPPVWFSEYEDISDIVQYLSNTTGNDNYILEQIKILCSQLCELNSLPIPAELNNLCRAQNSNLNPSQFGIENSTDSGYINDENQNQDDNETSESEDSEMDEEDDLPLEEPTQNEKIYDGISLENTATLERLKQNQRESHLNGSVTGSVQATDRLMKELREVYRSESFKRNVFKVDLIDDSLYEWNVKLFVVDSDSPLHEDLKQLKEKEGRDHILLHIRFKENYLLSHHLYVLSLQLFLVAMF